MNRTTLALTLSLCSLTSYNAFAVGGVPEINHNCAMLLGCFSGDTPGYPITIDGSAGGSYRVSSDLIVPDADTNGILITTSSISVDLGGFEIARSACESATTDCTPATGNAFAIGITSGLIHGTKVSNGSVTGMGIGVAVPGPHSEASNIRARWNRFSGIWVGNFSVVRDSLAFSNGTGIRAGIGSIVSDNVSRNNANWGLRVGNNSMLVGNTASNGNVGLESFAGSVFINNTSFQNTTHGIRAANGSLIHDNTTFDNGFDGIFAGSKSAVAIRSNTSYSNRAGINTASGSLVTDNTAHSNSGNGIDASEGSLIQGNTLRNNSGFGLMLDTDAAYRRNVITGNSGGDIMSGVTRFNNFCNTTFCP